MVFVSDERRADEIGYKEHFKWPYAAFLLLFSLRGWWSYLLGGCRELEREGEIITPRKKLLCIKPIFVAYLLKVH